MNNSFTVGAVVGAMVVTAGGATAAYKVASASHVATVISATPLTRTVRTPRQECHDEKVTHARKPKDEHRLVGTGIGAVVGGLLGNQVGGGNGRTLATVAGAAAGGYAGNRIEQKVQRGNLETSVEHRCVTVYDSAETPAGFDVIYTLDGARHHVHLDHDPGKQIPVRDGRIVVDGNGSNA